jgi:hypothetical protein
MRANVVDPHDERPGGARTPTAVSAGGSIAMHEQPISPALRRSD